MKTHLLTSAFSLIFLFLLFSCADAQKNSPSMEDLQQSNSEFMRLFNSGKIDSISDLYIENACMMTDNLPEIKGREGIREYYKDLFDLGFRFIDIRPLSVVNSDRIYVERGTWTAVMHEGVKISGTYLSQSQLRNKKWFIENEMTRTDGVEGSM